MNGIRMGPRLAVLLVLVMAMAATASADPLGLFEGPVAEVREHAHKEVVRPLVQSDAIPTSTVSDVPCEDGMAGTFPCSGVDLLSFVPLDDFRGSERLAPLGGGASDLWGWTDPEDGGEYVIMGKTNGSAFFNVTDPLNPVYLGDLPNPSPGQLIWHDIKVYENHAFIVSESVGHGMLVVDLTRLRGVTEPRTWSPDAVYPIGFSVHNIAINEDSGYAYLVGGNNGLVLPDQCRSGLHMVDISTPTLPVFAGCHAFGEGAGTAGSFLGVSGLASYIHDTQCVTYDGPDARYEGRELCFNSSEDHLSIVDVTDKLLPVQVGLAEYPDTHYAHQGWLTDDGSHFMLGDELDEQREGTNTRTLIFDVSDIEAPFFVDAHEHETAAIDHNMYVKNGLVYQSNYAAGLRILDTAPVAEGRLDEVAFFDSFPDHDLPQFVGTWSNYPYFESGTIAFSGIDEGLFLVRVHDGVLEEFEHGDVEDGDEVDFGTGTGPASEKANERASSNPSAERGNGRR
jgi:choice-of-anchor B domain-containing protein